MTTTRTPNDQQPVWKTAEDLALIFEVNIRTIWAWRRRGHITRINGHYDLHEVEHWWHEKRDTRMADIRQRVARTSLPV